MKKYAVIAATTALVGVGFAVPAQAYDRELYSYAAAHMIAASDVAAPLQVKKGASFSAYADGRTNFLCNKDEREIAYPGGAYSFSMSYAGRKDASGVTSTVNQYASAKQAIAAFDRLKKGATECAGPASGQESYDDGSTDTWSRVTTTGSVPLVTIAGVASVFVNENYEDVTVGQYPSRYTSDNYNVYTLVNDVIINTSHYTGSELNMSTKDRRAVNQTAFNAVTRWLD